MSEEVYTLVRVGYVGGSSVPCVMIRGEPSEHSTLPFNEATELVRV